MVQEISILGMEVSKWISLFVPILLIVFLKVKYKVGLKAYFIGVLAFILGGVIIPSIIQTILQMSGLTKIGTLSLIIVAVITAISQETSKKIALTNWVKTPNGILDSITFGVGFTAIQSIIMTTMNCAGFIGAARLINSGKFFDTYSQMQVSEYAIKQVNDMYINTHYLNWWLIGIQVIVITIFHIAMTNLVYKSIKEKNNKYYIMAIVIDIILMVSVSFTLESVLALSIKGILLILVAIGSVIYMFKELQAEKIITHKN